MGEIGSRASVQVPSTGGGGGTTVIEAWAVWGPAIGETRRAGGVRVPASRARQRVLRKPARCGMVVRPFLWEAFHRCGRKRPATTHTLLGQRQSSAKLSSN